MDDTANLFECIATLEGHENEVKSCAWDCNGQLLATCGRDKTVWIWEALNGYADYDCTSVLNGHTQDVKCVQWHPEMEMLLTGSYDDTIRSWIEDIDDWYCVDICRVHKSTVWSLCCNKTGSHMASVSDDKELVVCELIDQNSPGWAAHTSNNTDKDANKKFMWKEYARASGIHKRTIYSVDWARAGHELIATASGDDAIRLFKLHQDPSTGKGKLELVYEMLNAHETDLNCVAWNPAQPHLLATASDDSTIKIWQLVNE